MKKGNIRWRRKAAKGAREFDCIWETAQRRNRDSSSKQKAEDAVETKKILETKGKKKTRGLENSRKKTEKGVDRREKTFPMGTMIRESGLKIKDPITPL